ncbi:subtilisin-like protein [Lactarius indigo]|nr:subtilisin-like protein [Lactarius indigo]
MHVKHAWNSVPVDWESMGPPPVGTTIDLRISLKPHHEDTLIDVLYEVSNPKHPKYGAHLSKEQVAQIVAPHPNTLELVNSWLGHHGVSSSIITTRGNWLTLISVPVCQANHLLDTILRTISYALPAVLHAHVETVVPTTYFDFSRAVIQAPRVRPGDAAVPPTKTASEGPVTVLPRSNTDVVPSYLRWFYNTSGYVPAAPDKNALGTLGFLQIYPSEEDLALFMKEYKTDGMGAIVAVKEVGGSGYDPDNPGIEANLNIQYAVAMTYPTRNVYYSVGLEEGDVLVTWLEYILDEEDIPQTIVMMYGAYEQSIPLDYAKSVCRKFLQLGARGVSVLVASGNQGVGGGDCTTKDSSSNDRVQFTPMFPADCPWVTVVGGTTSHNPGVIAGRNPEVAASLSGGGFSNIFRRPPYQENAVKIFLQNLGGKYDGLYNPEGRGYPDIAAEALNYLTIFKKGNVLRQGTSCATPTVGGIISLLNNYRISKGKRPLGFLNFWLYGGGLAGLNDITSGSNPGCGTDGFPAIVGWDPVTGLGSPDFDILEEIVDNMD